MEFSMKLRRALPKRSRPHCVSSRTSSGRSLKRRKKSIFTLTKCRKCICCPPEASNFEYPTIWAELRANNQLCDGVVCCEDGIVYNIHRVILSAVSPYFKALFTNSINGGYPELNEANIEISSDAFKVLLDYAYTGACNINMKNVLEVLKYADQYEILDVVELCCKFLMNSLSPTNCLEVLRFAGHFFCRDLMTKANIYIRQNFAEIIKASPDFCYLSVEHLLEILHDDYLNVTSEEVTFEAAKAWVSYMPEKRKTYLTDLLKAVRLGNLSYDKVLHLTKWPLLEKNEDCMFYIQDVLTLVGDTVEHDDSNMINTYLYRPRIPYDILFAIGGWSAGSPTNFVETYDNRADRWLLSRDTDSVPKAYHGMCSVKGKIYLIGGFDGNEYFNTVRRFDPLTHRWADCACMYYSRCYVSVALCKDRIYAIGGYNGRIRMNSAERYDPVRNQWQLIASMHKQRSDASAAALRDKIYVVGGFNGQEVMNSAEVYDPDTNQWSAMQSMASARSGVSLIAYKNTLYAIGGFNGYTRLPSGEKYVMSDGQEEPDEPTGRWQEISEMLTPRSNFGSVILDDFIYVIGGFNGSTTINYVEYYDTEADEWFDSASMNLNRSALSACVIGGLPNAKDYSLLGRQMLVEQGGGSDNGNVVTNSGEHARRREEQGRQQRNEETPNENNVEAGGGR